MRRRRRRTPLELGVRGLLALAAAGAGYFALTQTIAYSERLSSPELAYALAPSDGRVAAALSERLSEQEATSANRTRADDLARRALLKDPTAVSAAATLGLNAEIRGDHQGARNAFDYAQVLSRRDLQSQLWSIEDAVARRNIADALRHYDIALRTSHLAPDLLFPVLASAVNDTTIRTALARTLAKQPLWTQSFIEYVGGHVGEPQATASFFKELTDVGVPVSSNARTSLLNALIAKRSFEQAWAYYASIRPGVDRHRSRDPLFAAQLEYPSPFDWTAIGDTGISASIQRNGAVGVFDFAAPASVGGIVLRQMQFLPAGNYILEGHSIGIEQPAPSRPYWVLSCVNGEEFGRISIDSRENNGHFFTKFIVPVQCPVQYLSFNISPSDEMTGVGGRIDRIILRPSPR